MPKKASTKKSEKREMISSDEPIVNMQDEPTVSMENDDVVSFDEPALEEFFASCVKDIYWAENHLVKALPKMQKAATSNKLKAAIDKHLGETKEHVARLEKVFELLGQTPKAKKCDAMEGLTMEGESIVEETKMGTATRDVGIIMASQKVEHYEIATYGGLVRLATILGKNEIAEILAETLEEEKNADIKLTEIAENDINTQASEE